MPKPITDGANFKTKVGGCRPSTDAEKKHIQPLPQHLIDDLKAKHAARTAVKGSNLSRFNAQYPVDLFQAGTGICTGGAGCNSVMMAAVTQGVPMPMASAFFAYFTTTGDRTFTKGWSVYGAVAALAQSVTGWCTDALYPQAQAIAWFNAWPGHAFSDAELPQPPAYTDGATRRILQFYSVAKDQATIVALLRAGHPLVFGMGNHAVCGVEVSDDESLILAKDTEIIGDQGYGRGIRAFSMSAVLANGFDLTTVILIQPGTLDPVVVTPPPPTGNTQMLLDTIKADANALVLGQVTQAQIDKIKADVALLVVDPVVVTPPPPTALVNGGFETPSTGSYVYAPAGATWAFVGGAGISGNGNAFTGGNPTAPEGKQVAFIQGNGSSVAQTVSLNAGNYTVCLRAAQRGNYQQGAQIIRVLLDGVEVGRYQPAGTSYGSYQTAAFPVIAGSHVLTLQGAGSGTDFTAFVDDVKLTLAP